MLFLFSLKEVLKIENFTKIVRLYQFFVNRIRCIHGLLFYGSQLQALPRFDANSKIGAIAFEFLRKRNEADFLIGTFNGVISRLKEKEQELEKLHQTEKARADDFQQLNQDLIRSISSGLILIDQSGKVRVFNQAAESILKFPRTEVLNQPYEAVMDRISAGFKKDIVRCFEELVPVNRAEVEVRNEQGEVRYLGRTSCR